MPRGRLKIAGQGNVSDRCEFSAFWYVRRYVEGLSRGMGDE